MTRALAGAAAFAASLVLAAVPAAALEVPYLSGRVVDEAEVLSPAAEQAITARLEELERATGAQVAVLTVPGLGDAALEEYSLRVAETWGLGGAERDDGVLFLVARDDRKMRLEVGYGLEGTIPDILAGRILDNAVRPRFRAGDFDGGVTAGVDAVARLIGGESAEAVVPEPAPRGGGFELAGCAPMLLWIVMIFFVLPLVFGRKKRRFRVFGVPLVLGGFSGGRSGGGGFSGGGFSGGGGGFGGGGASSSW